MRKQFDYSDNSSTKLTTKSDDNSDDFIKACLRRTMKELQPKFRRHRKKATFTIHKKPDTTQVFVRHNAPTGSLQMPYGPYQVLSRSEKTRYESMDDPCHWTG